METIAKYFHLIIGMITAMFLANIAGFLLHAVGGHLLFGAEPDPTSTQFWLLATDAGKSAVQFFVALGTFSTFAIWTLLRRIIGKLLYKGA